MRFLGLAVVAVALVVMGVSAMAGAAGDGDSILGQWLIADGKIRIEVTKVEGRYFGRVVWLKEERYPKKHPLAGQIKCDRFNPDPAKRKQPLVGLEILKDLEYVGNGQWENGTIYNADDGRVYQSFVKQDGTDELKVRGYLWLDIIGKSITAKRYDPSRPEKNAKADPNGSSQ